MPRGGYPSPYQRLADYLADCPQDEVTFTFREIAAFIGRPLPEEAILQANWWTNDGKRPVQLWQAMGWRARADRDHLRVVFTHTARPEE